MYMYIYIYIYIYIYNIYIYIYIKNKIFRFGFFQTFEESSKVWKKPNYNSLRNKCLVSDIYIY